MGVLVMCFGVFTYKRQFPRLVFWFSDGRIRVFSCFSASLSFRLFRIAFDICGSFWSGRPVCRFECSSFPVG